MKESKFNYSCPADSKIGVALQGILTQCNEANKAAEEWAKKHFATEYLESGMHIAGGVVFLSFNHTPDGRLWKSVTDLGEGEWYEPNVPDDFDLKEAKERQKNGKPLSDAEKLELERLALPTIDGAVLLGLLNAQTLRTRRVPAFFLKDGKWWIKSSYPLNAEGLTEESIIAEP